MKNLFVREDQSNLGICCYQQIALIFLQTVRPDHTPQIHAQN